MNGTLIRHIPYSIRPKKALSTLLGWYIIVFWLRPRHSAIMLVPTQIAICQDIVCTGCSVRRRWSNCFSSSNALIMDTLRNKCCCKESIVCLVGRSFTFDTDQSRLLLRQTGVVVCWASKIKCSAMNAYLHAETW